MFSARRSQDFHRDRYEPPVMVALAPSSLLVVINLMGFSVSVVFMTGCSNFVNELQFFIAILMDRLWCHIWSSAVGLRINRTCLILRSGSQKVGGNFGR